MQVLRDAAQKQQRRDEQSRVDTWILNMEAELAKVRRWVTEADAGEEVLEKLPLSAADKVEKFQEVLSKILEPQKDIPWCSDLDELMDTICMKKRDLQENIRISANELQKDHQEFHGKSIWTRPMDAGSVEHFAQGIL